MPTSTFWNQVRLLTSPLEPLITVTPATHPTIVCLPWDWTGTWHPQALFPDAALFIETPELAIVRTPLHWRLQVWTAPSLPGTALLLPVLTDPTAPDPPDDRLWCAVIEVLAGTGHRRIVLAAQGETLIEGLPTVVSLSDHINWTRDNYLVGYPVEDDTPSRFIDTQTLYNGIDGLPAVIGCLVALPALQTPAERMMARQLGGGVVTGTVGLLALLAHFKQMQVTTLLRLDQSDPSAFITALHSMK